VAIVKNRSKRKRLKPSVIARRNKMASLIKRIIPVCFMLALSLVLLIALRAMFYRIPFFRIKEIRVKSSESRSDEKLLEFESSELLMSLRGKNIFKTDIHNLAKALRDNYPQYRQVIVRRIVPDVLEIDIIHRTPVLLIKSFGYYPADKEGVVLSPETDVDKQLPVVLGISMWARPKVGEHFDSTRLTLALDILRHIGDIDVMKKYVVRNIDVSNLRNPVVILDNGLEIRLGKDDMKKRFNKLEVILNDTEIDIMDLAYIDLRFKETVLGPR